MITRSAILMAFCLWAFGANGAASAGDDPVRRGPTVLEVVVLSSSGKPCAGADVWAREREARPGMDSRNSFAKCDASGAATLRELRPSHLYDIRVFGRDPLRAFRHVVCVPPGTSRITLKASPGLAVSGRVIDEKGEPVAGASVHLSYPGRHPPFWAPAAVSPPVAAGSDGAFTLQDVEDGVWGLVARAPGSIGWRTGVAAGADHVVLSLRRSRTLVATGPGASVRGSAATLTGVDVPFRLRSRGDEKGVLRFTDLPEGSYYLSVEADPSLRIPMIRLTDASPQTVRIAIPPEKAPEMLRIRGRIGRSDETAAGGAKVGLFVDRPEGYLSLASAIVNADETGRFVAEVPARAAGFPLRAVAVLDGMAGISEVWKGEGNLPVVLSHPTGRIEEIRVRDAETGEGVEGAEVDVLTLLGGGRFRSGPDGRVPAGLRVLPRGLLAESPTADTIEKLVPHWTRKVLGTAEIRVHAPGYLPVVRVLAESRKSVLASLQRAPVVEGRVVDREGRPAAGIRVRTADGTADADTDSDGRFVLILARDDPKPPKLVWSPLPDWRPVGELPALEAAKEKGVYLIPDSRRWPLELAFDPGNEGRSASVTLPGAPTAGPGPLPQAVIDSRGRCRDIRLLAGDYVVRILEAGRVVREFNLFLEEEPAPGVWRRSFVR